ncbi:hypothetical protein P9B03_14155 [Metasolibacillus meyeri]|uniref:Uncharacterized protein n=1 Tax=Metasolibacillus meyeri TaxID=1071052 RepID=A0AAW9NUT2_9BACL|nr:hypothetical protein [Metasolibacillus meyeri]MEC1179639.1 hypothetical protein [Metasolibacillus meyeri]
MRNFLKVFFLLFMITLIILFTNVKSQELLVEDHPTITIQKANTLKNLSDIPY